MDLHQLKTSTRFDMSCRNKNLLPKLLSSTRRRISGLLKIEILEMEMLSKPQEKESSINKLLLRLRKQCDFKLAPENEGCSLMVGVSIRSGILLIVIIAHKAMSNLTQRLFETPDCSAQRQGRIFTQKRGDDGGESNLVLSQKFFEIIDTEILLQANVLVCKGI